MYTRLVFYFAYVYLSFSSCWEGQIDSNRKAQTTLLWVNEKDEQVSIAGVLITVKAEKATQKSNESWLFPKAESDTVWFPWSQEDVATSTT